MDEATKCTQALRHVLFDLDQSDTSTPTPLNCDNQGSISWSLNHSNKKMRHFNIRENAVREAILFDEVDPQFVPGCRNIADLFTKEFKSSAQFTVLRDIIVCSRSEGGW